MLEIGKGNWRCVPWGPRRQSVRAAQAQWAGVGPAGARRGAGGERLRANRSAPATPAWGREGEGGVLCHFFGRGAERSGPHGAQRARHGAARRARGVACRARGTPRLGHARRCTPAAPRRGPPCLASPERRGEVKPCGKGRDRRGSPLPSPLPLLPVPCSASSVADRTLLEAAFTSGAVSRLAPSFRGVATGTVIVLGKGELCSVRGSVLFHRCLTHSVSCCSEVTEKVEEVEKVEKVEEKKVEESAEEPSIATENGHSKEASEEEPSENGTAEEEAEEKEAESTENGTSEVTATKRKSTGGDEATDAAPEGVSPEKKAKLAESEEKEASNGSVEAEATA
ncbi:hypothetical protein ONE63_000667 [Megalurothrips usitatus]|uniref:Uncharacterized protein n=1 Tax=Megalurothrips usitatus TaxID=439358 RepID=A0AAV7Y2Y6_9NEOP|nr:hypothetical protein ONE63_000667 [Megalurothrips usitatus]